MHNIYEKNYLAHFFGYVLKLVAKTELFSGSAVSARQKKLKHVMWVVDSKQGWQNWDHTLIQKE